MNQNQDILQAAAYLKRFTVDDNQYIIGIYQKGITIHNQQVRALNIFHCLHLQGLIHKDTRVGIIGGGIAGLTFAAAALHSRIKVSLFEKDAILLPLQTGCMTRFIHPNIYSWPADGFEVSETMLPVLNWEADRADLVAQRISSEFDEIRTFYEKRGLDFNTHYQQTLNSGKIVEITKKDDGKLSVSTDKGGLMVCDVLIYAVGFGIERSEFENTASYWRCTDISQEPDQTTEYLISGVGDGAFMDLITALIRDFDYKKITDLISENPLLIQLLQDSRNTFFTALEISKNGGDPLSPDFMFKEFSQLRERYYSHILDKLNIRDFPIVLHSRKPFEHIFDLSKVSMLNAFLVFLLRDKFKYHEGEYNYDKTTRFFTLTSGDYHHMGDRVFFRHGTKREQLLSEIPGLTDSILNADLKNLQQASLHDGDIQRLWIGDDFEKRFEQAYYDEIPAVTGNALQCLETFTRSLAGQLSSISLSKMNFRLTMHKVKLIGDKVYYQQITPYYGHPKALGDGGFGRLFSWNVGSVGYSILKGKSLLILKKDNESDYRAVLEQLALTGKEEDLVNSDKKCFFTLPFLSKIADENAVTNFILYIDSEDANFFTPLIFDAIHSAAENFSESFESLVAKGQLQRGNGENPFIYLNEDDKKLFNSITKYHTLIGESSEPYKNFKEILKKHPIREFIAFNSLS